MAVELSIIMPCLNEAATLATCIQKAQRYLLRAGVSGEVVVGDNGSSDGSQAIAAGLGAQVVAIPMRGYGATLHGAVMAARGRYCIMGDSDDSYDFEHLDGFLDKLRAGFDLVMGNRFQGGIAEGAMPWKNRHIGNPLLSGMGRMFFRAKVGDFHCGIRGFSKEAFRRMDLRTTGMEFASEMVIKATLLKLKIAEVPATLSPDGRARKPHLRPYRDGWRHMRFMLLFSPDWLFFYPGLLMVAAGALVGGMILSHPIYLNRVRLGLDTLIYCSTLLLTGFQAILFSLLSRAYAIQEGLYPKTLGAKRITPGRGLFAGAGLLAAGLVSAIFAFLEWKQNSFGDLVTEHIARIVIPSSVAISLGGETVLFSLLLSTFGLSARPYRAIATDLEKRHSAEHH